jgi:hypothetical protein
MLSIGRKSAAKGTELRGDERAHGDRNVALGEIAPDAVERREQAIEGSPARASSSISCS